LSFCRNTKMFGPSGFLIV